MTCCIYCVNRIKIKKAARVLRSNLPLRALVPPFPIVEVIESLKIEKGGKWYDVQLVETNKIPYQVESLTFSDKNCIKVLIVENYEKYFNYERKRWTLAHELSHICLGHIFICPSELTNAMRWYLDKEANKLAREILLCEGLVNNWLCKREELSPLIKEAMASAFGVSKEALNNTLEEYGILGDTSRSRCLFYPDVLDCVSYKARKGCIFSGKPNIKCLQKIKETEFDVNLSLSSFHLV